MSNIERLIGIDLSPEIQSMEDYCSAVGEDCLAIGAVSAIAKYQAGRKLERADDEAIMAAEAYLLDAQRGSNWTFEEGMTVETPKQLGRWSDTCKVFEVLAKEAASPEVSSLSEEKVVENLLSISAALKALREGQTGKPNGDSLTQARRYFHKLSEIKSDLIGKAMLQLTQ